MKLHLYFTLIIAFAMVGCASLAPLPTPTAEPTAAPTTTPKPSLAEGKIVFTRYDGKKYSGTVYGHGETAIILANMSYGGESQWDPFVKAIDKEKFTAVTFNYLMLVADDYASAEQETEIILDTLKSAGYKRAICIGASLGVSACGYIAHDPTMVGIATIAGPNNGGLLTDITYPKLFIAGQLDQWSSPIKSDYKKAIEPKTLIIYPDTAQHGTDLFYSPVGDEFLKALLDFVNNIP